jgi:aryl-alcohol dehydrogenase-like predicted oxidoreductase
MKAAYDSGINFFDSAEAYAGELPWPLKHGIVAVLEEQVFHWAAVNGQGMKLVLIFYVDRGQV